MKINILTLFPEFYDSFKNVSIVKKALLKNKVEINIYNIRDYSLDKTKRVDDHPFGGGAGLIMKLDPIIRCLRENNLNTTYKIVMSADACLYNQKKARELVKKDEITIICGHYEGIDSRISNYIDEKISIGDYILSGGEVSSLVVIDSIVRLIDGVITLDSTLSESYENNLLEYDQFTYPIDFEGHIVPSYLLNGNHQIVDNERIINSYNKTKRLRPDILKKHVFSKEEMKALKFYRKK